MRFSKWQKLGFALKSLPCLALLIHLTALLSLVGCGGKGGPQNEKCTGASCPDTEAPTVSISSPDTSATVNGTVQVDVSASDNVGVAKVELYVDNSLVSSATESPFIFPWDTTTAANGAHTLLAKAYDVAGNVGNSSPVSVIVTPVAPFEGKWYVTQGKLTDSTGTSANCNTSSFSITYNSDSSFTISQRTYSCGSNTITGSAVNLELQGSDLLYGSAKVGTLSATELIYTIPFSMSGTTGSNTFDLNLSNNTITESGSTTGSGLSYSFTVTGVPVRNLPPSNLMYPKNPAVYSVGIAIGSNTPAYDGDPVASFTVSPQLPLGLSIDQKTGVISGTPTQVTPLGAYVVTASNAGGSTTATLNITVSLSVISVTTGSNHACAVLSTGSIKCWGQNGWGQLGNNSNTASSSPVQVQSITQGATQVAAGEYFTCGIVNGGAVCWGYNGVGQLGNGSTASTMVPVPVQGLGSGVTAIAAAAGYGFACAIVNSTVKCWGEGYGTAPVTVSNLPLGSSDLGCSIVSGAPQCSGGNSSNPPQLSGGTTSSWGLQCAIASGDVQCWGNLYVNSSLQDVTSGTPVAITGLGANVSQIALNGLHYNYSNNPSYAIVDGVLKSWNWGQSGQITVATITGF